MDGSLYTSQGFWNMDELLNIAPNRVTLVMNEELERLYMTAGVEKVSFQMAPSKAPGADGFPAGFFFQQHWSSLKEDVLPAILDY
jgi:hypothetical protein